MLGGKYRLLLNIISLPGFNLDLAHELGFGEEYNQWLEIPTNISKSPEQKVKLEIILCIMIFSGSAAA